APASVPAMTSVPPVGPGAILPNARSREAVNVIGRITLAVALPVAVAVDWANEAVAPATSPAAINSRSESLLILFITTIPFYG
ncbi:MAG: hypothetical protein M3Y55_16715, partial [Pseudomonadota bacterium]|nr:hypothetical protein [Pseudomonadota bacterium]